MPSRAATGAVLFHVYEWDAFTERQAAAMAERSRGLNFYVIADETRGEVPVRGFPKIAHRAQTFADQGLPLYRGLWWNSDYALYHAARVLPAYDYYLRFDADVRVTFDLIQFVELMSRTGCSWLSLRPRGVHDWQFRHSLDGLPYSRRAYVPLMAMLFSREAVLLLEAERKACAASYRGGGAWPFCEGFVPSLLLERGMTNGGIGKVANVSLFHANLALLESDERVSQPGGIYHAVLDLPRFCKKLNRHVHYLLHVGDHSELARLFDIASRHNFGPLLDEVMERQRTRLALAGATPAAP